MDETVPSTDSTPSPAAWPESINDFSDDSPLRAEIYQYVSRNLPQGVLLQEVHGNKKVPDGFHVFSVEEGLAMSPVHVQRTVGFMLSTLRETDTKPVNRAIGNTRCMIRKDFNEALGIPRLVEFEKENTPPGWMDSGKASDSFQWTADDYWLAGKGQKTLGYVFESNDRALSGSIINEFRPRIYGIKHMMVGEKGVGIGEEMLAYVLKR